MKPARLVASALVASAALAASARPARAVERQHHLGLAPHLGILAVRDKSTPSVGAGLALHYAYGLDDQWNLLVEGGHTVVALDQQQDRPDAPRNRPAWLSHAGVGIGYVLDVIRWVPYFGVLGNAYWVGGGTLETNRVEAGAALALGLDYQLGRHLAVGVAARQHFLLSNAAAWPSFTTVGARLEWMWGY